MKKFLIYLLVTLAVLAIAAYVVASFFLGRVVTAGVNRFAPQLVHTKVVLESASFSPLSGGGTLTGLTVGNPSGWSQDNAVHLGKVHVEVVPSSFVGDHVIVKDVEVDQPEILYETKFISSNIGDLLKGLERRASSGDTSGEPKDQSGKPLKFEVKHLVIKDPKIRLGVGPTAITVPMPSITLDNIGTAEGGISGNEVALAIMRSVSADTIAATAQALGKIGSTAGATAGGEMEKAGEKLKSLFGGQQ